jgi:hypothetical protein
LRAGTDDALGPIRIPLDVAALVPFVERGGWIGLRLTHTGGQRLFLASRDYYVPTALPVVELTLESR